MKYAKRTAVMLLTVFVLTVLFPACSAKGRGRGSGNSAVPYSFAQAESLPAAEDMSTLEEYTALSKQIGEAGAEVSRVPGTLTDSARVLVRNAEIRIRVNSLEAAEKAVAAALEQHQGYAAYSNVYDNSRHYTLKVPAASYDSVLTGVSGIGKVLSRSERVEDATIQFYDLESRLRTKEELLKTFQSYLGQAKTIDEIMTVEKRIAELQQEIEWTGSQLSGLAHLVNYATIDIELLGPVSDSSSYRPGIDERIGELFRSFGNYAAAALVLLTGAVIYGIPSFAVLLLLFWLFFGRIGLLRKAWRLVMGKKDGLAGPKPPEG
ncbi:MAG: DUF4349 domain-containing protein [Treponema sp.]|jgi:hypothetical protein|nr:DUF4349 domain-containing protein [Treponema sp.]